MNRRRGASIWTDAARLRVPADIALVSLDALPASLASHRSTLRATADVFGVALSHSGLATPKAVDCDTALLLFSLREAAALPYFARVKLGRRAAAVIDGLILDGLLEIERDATFVTGPAAVDRPDDAPAATTVPAALSRAALAHAAALATEDASEVARRLYCFNTIPLSPSRLRSLRGEAEVRAHLRVDEGPAADMLRRSWREHRTAGDGRQSQWLTWVPRRAERRTLRARYKLYVSPRVEQMADAFPAVVSTLTAHTAPQFKIGAHARGLLRPDKLVIYLESMERVLSVGEALRAALQGIAAQGVPFTAAIDEDGLLSWGIDPERASWTGARKRASWRSHVTGHLGASLIAARRRGATAGLAVQFALDRIRHAGIDSDTWAARSHEWETAYAAD